MNAFRAGPMNANPTPWVKLAASSIQNSINPTATMTAIQAEFRQSTPCEISNVRRRGSRSAITPPHSVNTRLGAPKASIIAPSAVFWPVRSKASQPRATICICIPKNENTVPVQSIRYWAFSSE